MVDSLLFGSKGLSSNANHLQMQTICITDAGMNHRELAISKLTRMLAERGLKPTPKRVEILLYLQGSRKPLSVDEIHQGVRQILNHRANEDSVDLVTVYRNLKQLTEAGCVQKSFFEEGRVQYAMSETRDHLHRHHIQCVKCEKIEPVPICLSEKHKKQFAQLGYKSVSHRLEFYGVCPACT